MGPWQGGQAELLRVPWADFNCLRLPEDARETQDDYVMLSDIFPTGWHAVRMSGLRPGEGIVIYGSGPVGCMAALSATTMGASKVMVVDRHPDRLRLVEQIGAIPSTTRRAHQSTRLWSTPTAWAPTVAPSAWATRHTTREAMKTIPPH